MEGREGRREQKGRVGEGDGKKCYGRPREGQRKQGNGKRRDVAPASAAEFDNVRIFISMSPSALFPLSKSTTCHLRVLYRLLAYDTLSHSMGTDVARHAQYWTSKLLNTQTGTQ